jgi:orotidine-5'-phosphate decarboxylase
MNESFDVKNIFFLLTLMFNYFIFGLFILKAGSGAGMSFNERLNQVCTEKNSLVCVGLDVDLNKVPSFILEKNEPLVYFCQAIIAATLPYAAAYKINTAFFEAYGVSGWEAMSKVAAYLPDDVIKIADAKRGDIGNTSQMYARAFFQEMNFDAMTVNPYLGYDAVAPFLEDENKGAFILCHTSNKGAADFQKFSDGKKALFERVAEQVQRWNVRHNCGLVVGATFPEEMKQVRRLVPELPFLVPGLGAQGGDFELAVRYATEPQGLGAIFNFSRGIIYRSAGEDFAEAAGNMARQIRDDIAKIAERR